MDERKRTQRKTIHCQAPGIDQMKSLGGWLEANSEK
jgi:hypothetical protein